MYFNCYLGQMFVSDVSDFKFVGKVKPAFFIAKEEVFKKCATSFGNEIKQQILQLSCTVLIVES